MDARAILTDMVDKNGEDVIVAVHLSRFEHRIKVNRIASMYGKNNIDRFVNAQIGKGNMIAATKKVNHGLRTEGSNCPSWFKPTLTLTIGYTRRITLSIAKMHPKHPPGLGRKAGRTGRKRLEGSMDPTKNREQYEENAREIEDMNVDDAGAWYFARDIRGFGVRCSKNLRNNADAAFKNSAEGRKWFRDTVETPLYHGKEKYTAGAQKQADIILII